MHTLFHIVRRWIVPFTIFLFILINIGFHTQQTYAETRITLSAIVKYDEVGLSWITPDIVIPDIVSYVYSSDDGLTWQDVFNSDNTTVAHTVLDLTVGVPHVFVVQALDAADNVLAVSNRVTILPGKITHGINGLRLTAGDLFGASLAFLPNGKNLFVGAPGDDTGKPGSSSNKGAVHVLTERKGEDTWVHDTKIAHGTNGLTLINDDSFGTSLTISPDGATLFVGAVGDDTGGENRGAVHIFARSSDNEWAHSTKIAHGTSELNLTNGAAFGTSLTISPDGATLFVGAIGDDTGGENRGAVHIFTKHESTWKYSTKIAHDTNGLTLTDGDLFGTSLALSPTDGTTLFVSAVNVDADEIVNSGAVYIFTKRENNWTYSTKIAHNTNGFTLATGDSFGSSLALSPDGETLFVGAFGDNDGKTKFHKGTVYIFTKHENTWQYNTKIADGVNAITLADGDYFGNSLTLSPDGKTLFVGAFSSDVDRADSAAGFHNGGAVYVFRKDENVWKYDAEVAHGIGGLLLSQYNFFGISLAVSSSGNTLYVGANGDISSGFFSIGAVYIFTRESSEDAWTYSSKIADGINGLTLNGFNFFGSSLLLSADENVLYVGSYGAVHIFTRESNEDAWAYDTRIVDGTNGLTLTHYEYFGLSLALSPDENVLFVGAPSNDTGGTDRGAVYIFTRESSEDAWTYSTKVAHGTNGLTLANDDYFGYSIILSLDGTTLAVGAYGDDTGGYNKGAVHIFTKNSDNEWVHNTKIADGTNGLTLANGDFFGSSLVISSNKKTLIVGASRGDISISRSERDRGVVHIFTRESSEDAWTYSTKIAHGAYDLALADRDFFGSSLALSPDDSTLFVGTLGTPTGHDEPEKSAVYIFTKSEDSWVYNEDSWVYNHKEAQ